jgi:hypothetical protein
MFLRKTAIALMTGGFLLAGHVLPASAQSSCPELYSRMMGAYQNEGQGSPRYNELRSRYTERCGPGREGREGRDRRGGGQCEELRLACEGKGQLGERGEGNCRRYRETCERPSRQQICEELRQACMHKGQLGERGEGNCQKYRETCRR